MLDSWVRALEQLIAMPLDPQRFRRNFYVRAAAGFAAAAASLLGRILAVGDARLEVVSAIARCVVITNDVRTGDATPLVQRALARQRGNVMGIYCRTMASGSACVGDELRAIEAL
ncbi:MAG: MOSC domain-containing protein [Candidatus Eremiobacteraeota bacterium]|nr:MOSC domain-containing protein [Candidatus Eremiobacteraeota bacterium]